RRAPSSSTHTCRLLVFKEHSHEAPCLRCVAASAAEKGDYEEPFSVRQQVFTTATPADSAGKPRYCRLPRLPRFPRAAVSAARKSGILGACNRSCKRFFDIAISDV
ncbi:hypothetical protein AB4Y32_37585, partial [Paraburkholderia phymatum]